MDLFGGLYHRASVGFSGRNELQLVFFHLDHFGIRSGAGPGQHRRARVRRRFGQLYLGFAGGKQKQAHGRARAHQSQRDHRPQPRGRSLARRLRCYGNRSRWAGRSNRRQVLKVAIEGLRHRGPGLAQNRLWDGSGGVLFKTTAAFVGDVFLVDFEIRLGLQVGFEALHFLKHLGAQIAGHPNQRARAKGVQLLQRVGRADQGDGAARTRLYAGQVPQLLHFFRGGRAALQLPDERVLLLFHRPKQALQERRDRLMPIRDPRVGRIVHQLRRQLSGRAGALVQRPRQCTQYNVVQHRIVFAADLGGRLHVGRLHRHQRVVVAVALEQPAPRGHLPQTDPQRKNIAAGVQVFAFGLFGRHIRRLTFDQTDRRLADPLIGTGHAKIDNFGHAGVSYKNILWANVAMNHLQWRARGRCSHMGRVKSQGSVRAHGRDNRIIETIFFSVVLDHHPHQRATLHIFGG